MIRHDPCRARPTCGRWVFARPGFIPPKERGASWGDSQTAGALIMPDETPADRQHERSDTGPTGDPLRELTLGRPRPSPDPPEARPGSVPPVDDEDGDSETLEARC